MEPGNPHRRLQTPDASRGAPGVLVSAGPTRRSSPPTTRSAGRPSRTCREANSTSPTATTCSDGSIDSTYDNEVTLLYNPAGQIVGRSATNSAYAWTGHGNGTTDSTTDGLNRLTSEASASGTTGFNHDTRGNRLNDHARSYVYDSENKGRGLAAFPWHYDPVGRLSGASLSPGSPPAIAYES